MGSVDSAVEIRRIRAGEGLRLRALRLHALADAPTAFGSNLAREQAFPESTWHERAAGNAAGRDRVTVIAEDGGRWVGMATGVGHRASRSSAPPRTPGHPAGQPVRRRRPLPHSPDRASPHAAPALPRRYPSTGAGWRRRRRGPASSSTGRALASPGRRRTSSTHADTRAAARARAMCSARKR